MFHVTDHLGSVVAVLIDRIELWKPASFHKRYEMDETFTLKDYWDYYLLNCWMGTVVFIAGLIVLWILTRGSLRPWMIIALMFIQLLASSALSFLIWRFWIFPYPFDIMVGVISLPALISETITTFLIYKFVILKKRRKDDYQKTEVTCTRKRTSNPYFSP